MEEKTGKKYIFKNSVHVLLAHSYIFYFVGFLVGILLDSIFSFDAFGQFFIMKVIGCVLIILSTLLIFWAQKTSRNFKNGVITKKTFSKGPYHFVQNPTDWGIFLLIIGFGIIANAIFVILCTLFSFFASRLFFLKKQDSILAKKYGAPFTEYKESVEL